MDLASIVSQGIQGLSAGAQSYAGLREIFKDILNSIEKKPPETNWCTYINPMDHFKISWPNQRWAMREIGPIIPSLTYINIPIQLRFRLNPEATMIPKLMIGLFHNLMITVDLHGEIEMQQYVNAAKNDWLKIFGALDAKFYDERSVYKVETDNAIMAGRIVFQNTEPANDASGNSTISASHPKDTEAMDHNIWKFMRIIRFKERMYSIVGTVIESAGMDEIATNDLLSIMKTFVILEQ